MPDLCGATFYIFLPSSHRRKRYEKNKKIVIKEQVEECEEFIQMIKEFQRTNLRFLHTSRSQTKPVLQNVTKTEEFERGNGRGQNIYSPKTQTGGDNGEQ